MAKKNNEDILGQIFDFIYAQQELPPDKRKPIDATGIAGDKELVDAVAAILENPAIFNAEHMADNYADAVNIKLAELRFSEDNIKKAEIGTSNVVDIIKDPVGYARKVRDTNKAIRKSMRAKYLGAQATEFVVSSYLRKKGFSKELSEIIKNDRRFRDSMKEMYEFSDYKDAQAYAQGIAQPPMLSGADKEYLNARTAKLQAKLSMSPAEWRGLSDSQRNRITKGLIEANSPSDVQDALRDIFGNQRGDRIFRGFQGVQQRFEGYSDMEIANLEREMSYIESSNRRNGVWQDEAAELTYERTKLTKELLERSGDLRFVTGRKTPELLSKSRGYMENISGQITDIKRDLRAVRRSGNRSAERILQERLKMTKDMKRTMMRINLFGNIGQMEGYINSVRDYWNLESVIKGDFFKSTKNQFYCPTSKIDFEWNGKTMSEFMVPANHHDKESRRWPIKAYEEFWGRAYYFTPGSMFRTFFYNGEGFAWRAHLEKQKIKEFLDNSHMTGFSLDRFMSDRGYRERILNGMGGITNQQFLDMLDRYAKLGDMTQMFSILYRTQEKVLKHFNTKYFEPIRRKIYDIIVNSRMFSGLPDGAVAIGLLKQWAKKGGLRNLLKGVSQGIGEALGIVAGPGLNFVIGMVVGWLAERLYDLAVPLFGVLVYSILGLIGVLVMAYGVIRSNSISYDISASTPPGAVEYCDAEDPGFRTKKPWGSPVPIPPPTDSSCPLGDTPYVCTQGFTNTTCSHAGMKQKKPVDIDGAGGNIKYFYAPKYCDRSNCTASTVINPGRCSDGNYTGQWVTFDDGNGNVFTLGHTKYIPPSNGRNYSAGEPVAYVYQSAAELIADDPEQRTSGSSFYCWTGSHIHLLVSQNGTYVDPLALLSAMGCVNGPSSEAECPACNALDYD
jgi:predicted transcriptional regulator